MTAFHTILVANRGEIALRIMRTARSMGYRVVAVHSEADITSPHVAFADDAYCIGPAPAMESYLNIEKIIAAARATGAEAVHPGYGFLSENPNFARAVEGAGLVFIGPTPDAIEVMGNKAAAKRRMIAAGVSCVPGYEGQEQSDEALLAAATKVGFPIMVKAAAGGGGRGMRLVDRPDKLITAVRLARSEALSAFGSGELILERAILRPRHVEIQVFSDTHGNTVYLGERDCSVQRRHQKVVEEAPCPVMTPELRARMGETATAAARSINYRGAGTIEFLLDAEGRYYFLEMNTRLQVEHPVTELITGHDLVALQINVAAGRPLGFAQDEVTLSGHAIEVRLYAEDPANGFLPVSGRVLEWSPAEGDGMRIDAGICSGQDISPFYDPMLAKVIAWGNTRAEATARLLAALKALRLFGVTSNKAFLAEVLGRKTFQEGRATTAFISEEFPGVIPPDSLPAEYVACGAVLQYLADRDRCAAAASVRRHELDNWSSQGSSYAHARYHHGDEVFEILLEARDLRYMITVNESRFEVRVVRRDERQAVLTVADRRLAVDTLAEALGLLHIAIDGHTYRLRNELAFADQQADAGSGGRVRAIMHGVLAKILVSPGQQVRRGTPLLVLEAMKMQHEVRAEIDGIVANLVAREGSQVAANDMLLEILPHEKPQDGPPPAAG